jgi:plastocyanin
MRRALLYLLLAAVAASGAGAAALARKAPPHHGAKPRPAHKHKHKPHKKPTSHRPATTPTTTTPAQITTTPGVDAPPTNTTPTITTPADPTPAIPAAPLARTLGVTEADAPAGRFLLSLSRTLVGAGTVTVSVRNASQDPHDLRIEALDGTLVRQWDPLAPLAVPDPVGVSLTPGTYRIYCTLPGHAALGMDKQITVAAG